MQEVISGLKNRVFLKASEEIWVSMVPCYYCLKCSNVSGLLLPPKCATSLFKAGDLVIETRCQPKNFRQESQTLNKMGFIYVSKNSLRMITKNPTQGIFEDDNFPCPRVVNVGCLEGNYIIYTFSLSEYVHNLGHGLGKTPRFSPSMAVASLDAYKTSFLQDRKGSCSIFTSMILETGKNEIKEPYLSRRNLRSSGKWQ